MKCGGKNVGWGHVLYLNDIMDFIIGSLLCFMVTNRFSCMNNGCILEMRGKFLLR